MTLTPAGAHNVAQAVRHRVRDGPLGGAGADCVDKPSPFYAV